MQLINNELIYETEDTPKAIQFGYEWNGAAASVKATSPKIVSVEQQGIYNNEPRRFSVTTSEALTEGEVTAVLNAWSSYSPLTGYKANKVAELSNLSIVKRRELFSDERQINALSGVYEALGAPQPHLTKEQAIATINEFRTVFYDTKTLIEAAESESAVNDILAAVEFPTEIVTE